MIKTNFMTIALKSIILLISTQNAICYDLIKNNSMEQGNEQKANYFSGNYQYLNEDGNRYLQCKKTPEISGNADAATTNFLLPDNGEYELKIKSRGADGYIYVLWQKSDGKESGPPAMFYVKKSEQWQSHSFKCTPPDNTQKAYIILRSFDKERGCDFDQLHFFSPENSENNIENLIKNGDFSKKSSFSELPESWSGAFKSVNENQNTFVNCKKTPDIEGNADCISIKMTVIPNSNAELTGRTRGATKYIYVILSNSAGKNIDTKMFSINPSAEWIDFSHQIKIPEKAVSAQLVLRSFDAKRGSDFDDIEFIGKVAKTLPPELKNGMTVKYLQTFPSETTQTAAKELASYLDLTVKEKIICDGIQIKNLTLNVDTVKFANEEYQIENHGDTLAFSGGKRGILYAAYAFLENFLGIHWWNPQEEFVPEAKNWEFGKIQQHGKPFFMYRDIYRNNAKFDNGLFFARNRVNRDGDRKFSPGNGGSFNYGAPYHCHTFDQYANAKKYLETNPEFFSLRNGKRIGGQYIGQLCLTNPELKNLMLEKLENYIISALQYATLTDSEPARLFDISMNDNFNFCECPECKKEYEKYGHSGSLINFMNFFGKAIEKKYPEVFLTTLGYFYNEEVPKTKVEINKNVIVKFCDTSTNQTASIQNPENTFYRENLKKWSELGASLFIWDYGISYNFEKLPYPSELTYGELHRFYADNNVKGIFWEHENAYSADLYDMKIWLEAKLMEDPYQDFDKLCDIFYNGFYGVAGEYVKKYRQLLMNAVKANRGNINWFSLTDDFKYIDLKTLLDAHRLFDDAEKALQSDIVKLRRISRARLALDIQTLRLIRFYHEAWNEKNSEKPFPIDRKSIIARLNSFWLESVGDFENPDELKSYIKQEINALTFMPETYSPPEKFKNRQFVDFTVSDFKISENPAIMFINDSDAENKVAVRLCVDKDPAFYKLPMEMGLYDTVKATTLQVLKMDKVPEDGKYHWIKIGEAMINNKSYVYLSRSWRVQAKLDLVKNTPFKAEIYVRIKFSGSHFGVSGSGEQNYIDIDRITLVKL